MVEIPARLRRRPRPRVGSLVVPFMVDPTRRPVDFKALSKARVDRCAQQSLCGICGERIRPGKDRYAFLGPARDLECFGDPWMHPDCAEYATAACPFVSGKRRVWREGHEEDPELLAPYSGAWVLLVARSGRVHRATGFWHFQPVDVRSRALLEGRGPARP